MAPEFYLTNPVARRFAITANFNAPRDYTFAANKLQKHEGVDLAALDAAGQPVAVLAAQRGIVDKVGFSAQGYGNYVRIVHDWPDGHQYVTWYGHMSSVVTSVGQFVQAGTKIGVAGTTGFSTGVHLHLTLQHIGHGLTNYTVDDVVDPEPYFRINEPPPIFDDATFVADMAIHDGTILKPSQQFEKVWRIRNTGTTTWGPDYRLVFVSGNKMGGVDPVALSDPSVEPGQLLDVAVPMTAPMNAGRHEGSWMLRNASGASFGASLTVLIEIKETKPFDEITYVADVTVEDGTVIQPGTTFVKTWRVQNTGTTTWDQSYALRFARDNRMEAPERVPLARQVKPGEVIEISVTLTAPQTPGRHRSTWKLCNAQGETCEYEMYADIQVPRVQAKEPLNEMRFLADVSIPDGTQLRPGESFQKIWRVRNTGTTTWGSGYTMTFFRDEQMGGPDSVPLPTIKPGETAEIVVPLIAPGTAGTHKTTWKARDPQGRFFEFDLFALIQVVGKQEPVKLLDEMSWVADVTIPDGTAVKPGQRFMKTWRVRNTGTSTWGAGYTLAFFDGEQMNGPASIALPPAKPGKLVDVSFELTAPATPGLHKGIWKGRDPQGRTFEYDLFTLIEVVDAGKVVDMLDFLRGDGRVYEVERNGVRAQVQTQVDGDHFYCVKNTAWKEFFADEHFVYCGTDTMQDEVSTLMEMGKYGSAWVPRQMVIGIPFKRSPLVIIRRKSDGSVVRQFNQVNWIKLEAVHDKLKLASGLELPDVAELAVYADANGQPQAQPIERYYYAKPYGFVASEDASGKSCMVKETSTGSALVREPLAWSGG